MPVEWDTLRHFRREEWPKDPDRVSPDLVMLMDDARDAAPGYLGDETTFVIHVAFDDAGHVADSGHYALGREFAVAVDFHMERRGVVVPLLEQWLYIERYPFSGIGLYEHWTRPGLHVDLRRVGREHPKLGRRWYRDQAGAYQAIDRACVARLLAAAGG